MCRRLVVSWGMLLTTMLVSTSHAAEPALGASAAVDPAQVPAPDEPVDLSAPAPAPAPAVEEESWLTAPSERRCGFTLGLQLGGLVGAASGYPNDALKIDRDAYLTETGVAVGGSAGLTIGIALTDWFGVGIGVGFGSLRGSDLQTGFSSFGFHIDAYPAFAAGGAWRDLGLALDAGMGFMQTTPVDDEDTLLIESGAASRLGVGAFWEGIRPWKLGMGPFAMVDTLWSPSSSRPAGSVGWRINFYAGP